MPERNLAIRLSVMVEGGKVKAELKEIGESGEKSLQRIAFAGMTTFEKSVHFSMTRKTKNPSFE